MNTISITFLLWTNLFSHRTDIQGHNKNLISSFVPSISIFTPLRVPQTCCSFNLEKFTPSRPSPHTYPQLFPIWPQSPEQILPTGSPLTPQWDETAHLLSSSPREVPFLKAVAAPCWHQSQLHHVCLTTKNRTVKGNDDFTTRLVHDRHSVYECLSFQKRRSATYFV